MKTEVTANQFGRNPSRKRPHRPFALGAPRALVAPIEILLDGVIATSGAECAAAFSIDGRDVMLLAQRGTLSTPRGRMAARALAQGRELLETSEGRYTLAIPIAATLAGGTERRRLKPRSAMATACVVLEGAGSGPAEALTSAAKAHLRDALVATLVARAFADAVASDTSTGALTRAAFERAAGHELALAAGEGCPGALVLLEVVGRGATVEVERAEDAMAVAASALRRALRADDLIGRRGPDELSALLVNADPAHLGEIVARVMLQVGAALGEMGMAASALGAASFPVHGNNLEDLDAAALDALEGARAKGPGQTRIYDSRVGPSPTSSRHSFFTGDPGLDARKAGLLFESILAANSARDLVEALDAVLRALFIATGAERGAVLTGSGSHLEIAVARDQHGHPLERPLRISRSACLRALALGRATCVPDTLGSGESVGTSAREMELRSVITVPLHGRGGPVGVLYADSPRPAFRQYGPEDLAYLEALAAQAALAIENASYRERLEQENAALRRSVHVADGASPILGSSTALRDSLQYLPEIVEGASPVLILGESGTGKELLARSIHQLGQRAKGGFIAQNCAAIPLELLESELFGHAAGAFSGAARAKPGLLELADNGTFFLDEVAELPLALQAKLLRVLETKDFRRVGETRERKVDFRLLCATNRDLEREVAEGRFRRDLFYRINTFTVRLPPLRERRSDIPALAQHFAIKAAETLGRPRPEIRPRAIDALMNFAWPGNVRELANVIEKAVALAHDGRIDMAHLGIVTPSPPRGVTGELRATLARVERETVASALAQSDGNVSAAARVLGIARQQLQRLMRRYDLAPPGRRP